VRSWKNGKSQSTKKRKNNTKSKANAYVKKKEKNNEMNR
jgi:hypothetical protein